MKCCDECSHHDQLEHEEAMRRLGQHVLPPGIMLPNEQLYELGVRVELAKRKANFKGFREGMDSLLKSLAKEDRR